MIYILLVFLLTNEIAGFYLQNKIMDSLHADIISVALQIKLRFWLLSFETALSHRYIHVGTNFNQAVTSCPVFANDTYFTLHCVLPCLMRSS